MATKVARAAGDIHANGKWVWTEYKPGKFDWRPIKGGGSQDSGADGAKKAPAKPSSDQITAAKAAKGKAMNSQQLAIWATKTNETNLLKVANNKTGNAQMRKIAYDELERRGYDMSQVSTEGTLGDMLKMTGKAAASKTPTKTASDDTDADNDETDEEDYEDGEGSGITEKWYLDKNDDRVKKQFNLKTKEGRIKYDQFVFEKKKAEPDYMSPVETVQDLNEQYLEFLDNDEQRFMISAGGAGIGKSYGFNKMAELLNKKPFSEGDSPGDGDYDIFEAPDVNSGKQLLNILKAHNGKIIVFDDNDKVLRRADCAPVMKKATATTGKRIVGDPDDIKQNFEFTGRIIIMTNKDLAALSDNEDTKAIISRAMMVSEIYMTIPETVEVIESRYQDYEFKQAPRLDDETEDKQEREEVLDLIKKNLNNIDPALFSTRTFQEMLINKRKVDNANEKRKNPAFAPLIGDKDKDWKEKALATLVKAADSDFDSITFYGDEEMEKAEDLILSDIQPQPARRARAEDDGVMYHEEDMSVEKAEEYLIFGEDEVEKAEIDEFAEAEKILGI